MKPSARVGDMHACPLSDGPKPHVGGPVLPPGCATVLIGGVPAARLGDSALCVGPPDMIAMGAATVFIGGKPGARMGDMTAHGGIIGAGCATVLVGGPTLKLIFTDSKPSANRVPKSKRRRRRSVEKTRRRRQLQKERTPSAQNSTRARGNPKASVSLGSGGVGAKVKKSVLEVPLEVFGRRVWLLRVEVKGDANWHWGMRNPLKFKAGVDITLENNLNDQLQLELGTKGVSAGFRVGGTGVMEGVEAKAEYGQSIPDVRVEGDDKGVRGTAKIPLGGGRGINIKLPLTRSEQSETTKPSEGSSTPPLGPPKHGRDRSRWREARQRGRFQPRRSPQRVCRRWGMDSNDEAPHDRGMVSLQKAVWRVMADGRPPCR